MRRLVLVDLDNVVLGLAKKQGRWPEGAPDVRSGHDATWPEEREEAGTVMVLAFNEDLVDPWLRPRGLLPAMVRWLYGLVVPEKDRDAGLRVEPALVCRGPDGADHALVRLLREAPAGGEGTFDCVLLISRDGGLRARLAARLGPPEKRNALAGWAARWKVRWVREPAVVPPTGAIPPARPDLSRFSVAVDRPELAAWAAAQEVQLPPECFPDAAACLDGRAMRRLVGMLRERPYLVTQLGPTRHLAAHLVPAPVDGSVEGVARLRRACREPGRPPRMVRCGPADGVHWGGTGPLPTVAGRARPGPVHGTVVVDGVGDEPETSALVRCAAPPGVVMALLGGGAPVPYVRDRNGPHPELDLQGLLEQLEEGRPVGPTCRVALRQVEGEDRGVVTCAQVRPPRNGVLDGWWLTCRGPSGPELRHRAWVEVGGLVGRSRDGIRADAARGRGWILVPARMVRCNDELVLAADCPDGAQVQVPEPIPTGGLGEVRLENGTRLVLLAWGAEVPAGRVPVERIQVSRRSIPQELRRFPFVVSARDAKFV